MEPVPTRISDDEAVVLLNESRRLETASAHSRAVANNHRKRGGAAGMDLKGWAMALKGMKASDPDAVIGSYRAAIRYMNLMRLRAEPIGPADLFGNMPIELTDKTRLGMDVWDAEDGGYRAGRHGEVVTACPYDAGSELSVKWLEWWHKGQASIAAELGPEGQQAPVRRGRRKRQGQLDVGSPERAPREHATVN